jgi:pseudoazurin
LTPLLTRRRALISGAAATTLLATPAILHAATEHEVQMLNKHPDDAKLRNVFSPRILAVNPGDSVKFVAADKGHNSASAKGMIPEGTDAWKGKINEELSVTFEKPGLYGYVCTPHMALGMVGLVIVKGEGALHNIDAAKAAKQRGRAKQAWAEIWEEVAAMDMTA